MYDITYVFDKLSFEENQTIVQYMNSRAEKFKESVHIAFGPMLVIQFKWRLKQIS